ncbi:ABC transporter permease [Clostridium sp. CX1]|uniref:ABC transporter permease n=1 Tax=Clostridium tanneri TaxID=3037988 RepID=A0ABU4JT28_9CLOT|nr:MULTISPECIES: ABC transporter permease [unclassified Clostridium]MCT8978130.1 ABC transporter permease [Clostridium sp. CX1]MDW8801256.1 ABC transporter permease [Clostridium sp. A1-XYC3]
MKEKIFYVFRKLAGFKHILIPIIMLLVIPTMSSFILGYEFSAHQVSRVPTIIVNHDNSSTTQNLVEQIRTNETFNVIAYSNNDDDIKRLIDEGRVAAGILIPEGFSRDLLNGKSPKIMTFYDGAQSSLASSAKGKISEVLSTIKTGYLISIGEGKLGLKPNVVKENIIPMTYTSRFIGNPAKNMPNFMLQGVLLVIAQMGIALVGVMIMEKENYIRLFFKGILCALVGAVSISLTIGIQYKYFAFPYRGSIIAAVILTILFSIGMTNFGILMNLLKKGDKLAATSSCGIIGTTLMLSGYTYPLIAMPNVFSTIAKYIPFTYFAIPMRDLSLIGGNIQDVLPSIYWLSKFVIIMWGITFLIFMLQRLPRRKKAEKPEYSEVVEI